MVTSRGNIKTSPFDDVRISPLSFEGFLCCLYGQLFLILFSELQHPYCIDHPHNELKKQTFQQYLLPRTIRITQEFSQEALIHLL